ncbi:hypothetical protein FACS1894184_17810 [Clostridia bacterium]|nr:hypothetical protein FACS1894184_17810 [Clostridia bacterium]
MSDQLIVIGQNIHRLRKALDLTQTELGDIAGISVRQLQKIERNEALPRLDTLLLLAKALKAHPASLLLSCDDLSDEATLMVSYKALPKLKQQVVRAVINGIASIDLKLD